MFKYCCLSQVGIATQILVNLSPDTAVLLLLSKQVLTLEISSFNCAVGWLFKIILNKSRQAELLFYNWRLVRNI